MQLSICNDSSSLAVVVVAVAIVVESWNLHLIHGLSSGPETMCCGSRSRSRHSTSSCSSGSKCSRRSRLPCCHRKVVAVASQEMRSFVKSVVSLAHSMSVADSAHIIIHGKNAVLQHSHSNIKSPVCSQWYPWLTRFPTLATKWPMSAHM